MTRQTRMAWTDADVARLRELYPDNSTAAVAKVLGREPDHVYRKAWMLGIKKSDDFLKSGQAGRLDGVRGGATRFQPGHQTWNKGMKGLDIGGHATRFKAGKMPHNTREVGEYRINKDGLLQRKIGTKKGSNSMRWRGVHELVWVAVHGPVPPGHICIFKAGMRTAELKEITADKVECISFAENMRRNTYHRYPKDIALAIQMRGALNRKINRLMKETDDHPKQ